MKNNFKNIRSAIKNHSEHGRSLALEAKTKSGTERHLLHMKKREVGRQTRLSLLALAYARGRSYLSQESTHNSPASAYLVSHYLKDLEGIMVPWQEIEKWFNGEPAISLQPEDKTEKAAE